MSDSTPDTQVAVIRRIVHDSPPPRRRRGIVLVVSITLAATAVNGGLWWWYAHRQETPEAIQERINATVLKTAENIQTEHTAQLKNHLLTVAQQGDHILERITAAENEIKQWETHIAPLLTDERGRRLAANPEQVRAMSMLLEKSRPTLREAEARRQRVENLLGPIRHALAEANPGYEPSKQLLDDLNSEETQAEQAVTLYREAHEQIDGLLATAPPAGTANSETLETALNRLKSQAIVDVATKINAEDSARREALTLKRGRLLAIAQQGDQALDRVKALDDEIAHWNTAIATLPTSEQGKWLATKQEYVVAFNTLIHKPRPSPQTAPAIRERMLALLAPVKEALDQPNPSYEPSTALVSQLQEEQSKAEDAIRGYRELREPIEGMLAAAGRSGVPTTQPLQAAIEELQQQHAREQAVLIHTQEEEARKRNDRIIAEARKTQVLQAGDAETARIVTETERQARLAAQEQDRLKQETAQLEEKAKAEAQQQELKAKQDRLRKQAEDPNVQAKFSPFLAKGRYSFQTGQLAAGPSQPASYQALASTPILQSVEVFACACCGLGPNLKLRDGSILSASFQKNDRPRWAKLPATDAEWQEAQARLDQFKELAPVWKELGLLAP